MEREKLLFMSNEQIKDSLLAKIWMLKYELCVDHLIRIKKY